MRVLAIILISIFAASACSSVTIDKDDVGLYQKCKVFKPLILPKMVSDANPRITKAFRKAIARWEMAVPVEFNVFDGMMGPRGSISVVMGGDNPFTMSFGGFILGYFSPGTQVLFFNHAMEEDVEHFSDDALYHTCLHELGHVLGLPHFIGKTDLEEGGVHDIVLPTKDEARKSIMYPYPADDVQRDLTPIEILMARHFLIHDLNFTSSMGNCNYGRKENQTGPF